MEISLFCKCPTPQMVESIGIAGFDSVILDMEHTPISFETLYVCILAATARGINTILRVPSIREEYIKWGLDLGVDFIQYPHVNSINDVHQIRKYTYFSPLGERGLCKYVRAADFSEKGVQEYTSSENRRQKNIFQIEGVEGIKNAESIINSIPNGSSIFIGPYDLSQAVGFPGDIWCDDVVNKMRDIIQKCELASVKVGTFTDTVEGIKFWKKNGIDFLQYSSDLNLFMAAAQPILAEVRNES